MNCKEGDMALIIYSMAGNVGKVVTCMVHLRAPIQMQHGDREVYLFSGIDWWLVDRDLNMLTYANGKYEHVEDFAPFCRDDYMIPIGNINVPAEVKENETIPSTVQD